MKRIILLTFVMIFAASGLCACRDIRTEIPMRNGRYVGFADIPENYTPKAALRDGCTVVEVVSVGQNEYGATLHETKAAEGYGRWLSFVEAAEKGENSFLRVAYFLDGEGSYTDIYYDGENYTVFELNEFGVSKGESYKYLRRLEGLAGPLESEKEDVFWVLTDSTELTYKDVSWSFLSSDSTTVTDIPFNVLWFMIYFE